jgi:transposase
LLGLEGLKVLEVVEEEEGFVVIEVQAKQEETTCPHCGSKHLYKHGHARPRKALHAFTYGKRIYLKIQGLHRWKCRICGHTFTQRLEILGPKSRLTNMAEMWVLWLLKFMSFKEVAKLLRVSYGKIKKVLMDFVRMADLPGLMIDDLEELHIGIDEHSFRHQDMVIVVTDVKAKRVLGVLKDDRLSIMEEFLRKIPSQRVREVCIDMKDGFRKVAQRFIP